MAELKELSHKIHVLIAQLEQLHDENETLKHENKELACELARCRYENEMLKHEIEALSQKLQMNEMQAKEMSEPLPFARVKPYDSDWDASPVAENDRRKGGKKTSL